MPQCGELFETEKGGAPLGPPLGRGVSCGAVACQVKGDIVYIEKGCQKNIWEIQKGLRTHSINTPQWLCRQAGTA